MSRSFDSLNPGSQRNACETMTYILGWDTDVEGMSRECLHAYAQACARELVRTGLLEINVDGIQINLVTWSNTN